MKANFALAAGLLIAALASPAAAGELSYESRGYGGPLYIGPNFQQGGQHSPPVYDTKPSRSERSNPRHERVRETSKPKPSVTREAREKKSAPAEEAASRDDTKAAQSGKKAETENSTISSAALHSDNTEVSAKPEAATAGPITCKRYIAAVGQTVTVPCD